MVEAEERHTVPVGSPSRTFPIVAVLPDQGIFKPGMSLTAWVPTSQVQPRLTVARDAIMRGPTGTFVYVVRGGPEGPGAAASASLDVLFEFGDRAAVSSRQLRPGDLVVVEGNERLYPGAPVMATNAVPEGQPAAGDTSGGPPSASGEQVRARRWSCRCTQRSAPTRHQMPQARSPFDRLRSPQRPPRWSRYCCQSRSRGSRDRNRRASRSLLAKRAPQC
ncbi:MAG: hypothetical protein H6816_16020 [Phycisphaerales bacterium]|nr:hypothetical protein [Phycisphaerales bacterium]